MRRWRLAALILAWLAAVADIGILIGWGVWSFNAGEGFPIWQLIWVAPWVLPVPLLVGLDLDERILIGALLVLVLACFIAGSPVATVYLLSVVPLAAAATVCHASDRSWVRHPRAQADA